jgi:hypothetical protein
MRPTYFGAAAMYPVVNESPRLSDVFAVPSIAAQRLRAAVVGHSDVILRIALVSGALIGYALSLP